MEPSRSVIIQKRIDEVMNKEFEKMIEETTQDPLIKLLLNDKILTLSLNDIRSLLKGDSDA